MATLLQSGSASSGAATSITVNFASTTPHSFLVAYVASSTSGRTCSASDNVNGAYSTDASAGSSLSICSFPNNAGGNVTITGAITGANTGLLLIAEEWTGPLTVSPLDQHTNSSGTAATSGTTGTTGTLSQATELVLAALVTNSNSGTPFAVSSPFSASPASPVAVAAQTFFAAGNYQPGATTGLSATFTWVNSDSYRSCIATYKLAAVVGAPQVIYQRRYVHFNI